MLYLKAQRVLKGVVGTRAAQEGGSNKLGCLSHSPFIPLHVPPEGWHLLEGSFMSFWGSSESGLGALSLTYAPHNLSFGP